MSRNFHRVIAASEIEEQSAHAFIVAGWPVLLARYDDKIHALINRCTHQTASLVPGGRVRNGLVSCPLHGARFKLESGECVGGAKYNPLMRFEVRVNSGGWIEVAVPDQPPPAIDRPLSTTV